MERKRKGARGPEREGAEGNGWGLERKIERHRRGGH